MKGKTFRFRTGKPVSPQDYLAFLPTAEAERENAERFAVHERIMKQRDAGIGVIEALMGLAQQARG